MPRFYTILILYFILVLGYHQAKCQDNTDPSAESTHVSSDVSTSAYLTDSSSLTNITIDDPSNGTTTDFNTTYEDTTTGITHVSTVSSMSIMTSEQSTTTTTPQNENTGSTSKPNLGSILGLSLGLGIPAVLAVIVGIVFT